MQIQIVNPDTGAVLHTKQGLKLEADIAGHQTIPWWRPFKRHTRKALLRDLVLLLSELRGETRKV